MFWKKKTVVPELQPTVLDRKCQKMFVGYNYVDYFIRGVAKDVAKPEFDPAVFPFYDIAESGTVCTVQFSLPGYSAEKLKISIAGGILTITGDKPDSNFWFPHKGITTPPKFTRSMWVSPYLAVDKIKFENGVLSIRFIEVLPEQHGIYTTDFVRGTSKIKPFDQPMMNVVPVMISNTHVLPPPIPVTPEKAASSVIVTSVKTSNG